MTYYSIKEYDILEFKKSIVHNKKYAVILQNKITKKKKILNFGDIRYQHYYDGVPNPIYTHLNHNDKKRRENYRKRHFNNLKKGYYSPGYFSYYYLW